MNRTSIYISDEHKEILQKLKKIGKIDSISNGIRDALDIYLKDKKYEINKNQLKITKGIWNGNNS